MNSGVKKEFSEKAVRNPEPRWLLNLSEPNGEIETLHLRIADAFRRERFDNVHTL